MKEEVPCHNIFSACRRKLVLDGHMLMTCKYAAKEGLMLEVLDEIACDGIFLLKLIVPVWLGNCAIGQLSLVAPETHGCPPNVVRKERHVHAKHDGKAFGGFFLE